jgi:hypothetical protein
MSQKTTNITFLSSLGFNHRVTVYPYRGYGGGAPEKTSFSRRSREKERNSKGYRPLDPTGGLESYTIAEFAPV